MTPCNVPWIRKQGIREGYTKAESPGSMVHRGHVYTTHHHCSIWSTTPCSHPVHRAKMKKMKVGRQLLLVNVCMYVHGQVHTSSDLGNRGLIFSKDSPLFESIILYYLIVIWRQGCGRRVTWEEGFKPDRLINQYWYQSEIRCNSWITPKSVNVVAVKGHLAGYLIKTSLCPIMSWQ